MPEEFFRGRPDLKGVREGDHAALCTSRPEVRRWLTQSLAYVFQRVPGLGGVFTITASETLTNCASHGGQRQCPQCKTVGRGDHRRGQRGDRGGRTPGQPVGQSDRLGLGLAGRRDTRHHCPAAQAGLVAVGERVVAADRAGRPDDERGRVFALGGRTRPACCAAWELARKSGLRTVAKVQVNNSWELSTVPYLPVLDLVAEHAGNLARRQSTA